MNTRFIFVKKKLFVKIKNSHIHLKNHYGKKHENLQKNDYFGMIINTNEKIPEFTIDKIINQHKTEQITIKIDKKEYWYMMGYFMGDG